MKNFLTNIGTIKILTLLFTLTLNTILLEDHAYI
jgi:hypothetical protein